MMKSIIQTKGSGHKWLLYAIIMIAIPFSIKAQNNAPKPQEIRGVVVDDTNLPLPGVHIRIAGYDGGYITDIDGNFSIVTTNEKEVITFSIVGFETQTVTAPAGEVLHIKMRPSTEDLQEVVVTGFVNKSKESYTGSQVTVTKSELLSAGSKNLLQSLSTVVPGMAIVENNLMGSNPNAMPEINIRGRASFEGAANIPLFIVDGAQVPLEYIFDMDMNEVETVTVLKDASATALYGARGSAGVIVITTKILEGGKLRFTYNGTYRASMPDLTEYHLLNAEDKLEYERLAGLYSDNDGPTRYRLEEEYARKFELIRAGANTNWLAKPLRVGMSQNHNLSMGGGDEYARYNVSLRYGKDEGVMKGSGRDRLSGNFRLSYTTDYGLYISNMTSVNHISSADSPYGNFGDFAQINPYDTPYDDKGDLRPELSFKMRNPLYEASIGNFSNGTNLNFMNNTDLRWNINNTWRIDASFAITLSKGNTRRFLSPLSKTQLTITDPLLRGKLTEGNSKSTDYSGKLMATYNKYFTDKLFVSTTLGTNIDSRKSDQASFDAIGFYSDKLAHPAFAGRYPTSGKPSGSDAITNNVGFFINANAMYDSRYYLDLIFRYEGSSQFGQNQRFSPFWSLGGGWNIHNEPFMEGSGAKLLKLRGSVGYLGNVGFSPYQALTTLTYGEGLNYGKGIGAVPITIGNPDLKWERTLNSNIGIDLTLFDGRWDLTLDGYIKNTDNLLLDVTKAPSIGVETAKENIGAIINTGVELRTRVVPIQTQDLQWAISFNAAYNKNKIVKISDALRAQNEKNMNSKDQVAPLPIYEEGGSLTDLKVVPSAGIDPATGKEIFIKPDGSYTFEYNDRYKVTFGSTSPLMQGALSSYLIYKQWSLNMIFGYTFGAVAYNHTLATRVEGANPRHNADYRVFEDRWKTPGVPAKYKDIADSSIPYQTSRFVQTNNTVDLRSLSLAYEFRPSQIERLKLRSLRIELLTNNLFYISSIKQERGLAYPFERSVELSLRLSF